MKRNCAKCGKEFTLSKSQEGKIAWGQKNFYHSYCKKQGQSISVYPAKKSFFDI